MKFDSIEQIRNEGFIGFRTTGDLYECSNYVPDERGIYMVIYPYGSLPKFMVKGTGGYFKKKDPNMDLDYLINRWVKETPVLYIGQAGGIRKAKWSDATLRKRITAYVKFGNGHDVGHYGGRLIWQIPNNAKLIVCWKPLPNKIADPRQVEKDIIGMFEDIYEKRPFANIDA